MNKFSKDSRGSLPKLETGMVIRVVGEEEGYGPYIVLGNKVVSKTGNLGFEYFNANGRYGSRHTDYDGTFDIVAVYDGVHLCHLDLVKYTTLYKPIWKFQPSETTEKITELEYTIQLAMGQIKILKGEMNV